MPQFYDVTIPIREGMPVWPGDPPVAVQPRQRIAAGGGCNTSHYSFGSHVGTHIDAPFHFIQSGRTLDQIEPGELIGPCWVADLTAAPSHITNRDLDAAGIPSGVTRLLVKTRNSALWDEPNAPFQPSFVAFAESGARWVVARDIRLVGIDYLSVEPFHSPGAVVHNTLLGNDVVAIEGLDLRGIEAGPYHLICLPLRVPGADGCPVRAILACNHG